MLLKRPPQARRVTSGTWAADGNGKFRDKFDLRKSIPPMSPMVRRPVEQQIFAKDKFCMFFVSGHLSLPTGLGFSLSDIADQKVFIPNDDVGDMQERIREAVRWGAEWARFWEDGITVIVVQRAMDKKEARNILKLLPKSGCPIVVDQWIRSCIYEASRLHEDGFLYYNDRPGRVVAEKTPQELPITYEILPHGHSGSILVPDSRYLAMLNGETVDEFLDRLTPTLVLPSSAYRIVVKNLDGPATVSMSRVKRFIKAGDKIMQEELDERSRGRTDDHRRALKEKILDAARTYRVTHGKWTFQNVKTDLMNEWWKGIVKATVDGRLGTAAVISRQSEGEGYRICIYDNDFDDVTSIERLLQRMPGIRLLRTHHPLLVDYKCEAFTLLGLRKGNVFRLKTAHYDSSNISRFAAAQATRG